MIAPNSQQHEKEISMKQIDASTTPTSHCHYQWTAYHTFIIICLHICGDLMACVTLLFDQELSKASFASLQTFSTVNIGGFLGIILSVFWSPLNAKCFRNDHKTILVVYALLWGVCAICFGCTYLMKQHLQSTMIALQSILWTLYGLSLSICKAATIAIATQYSDPSNHGRLLSTINLSWSLSSAFYVVAAYLIELHPSLPFIVFGAFLLLFAMVIYITFHFESVPGVNKSNELELTAADRVNMTRFLDVLTDEYYSWLFVVAFVIGIASGANNAVLGSPLLQDLYGLNVFEVGWSLLVIFVAELAAALYMIHYVDKVGYFTTTSVGLALKVFGGILIVAIAVFHDADSWLSVLMALCMICTVFFAWEMVFISQLTALNDAVEINEDDASKRFVFAAYTAQMSAAKCIGIWFGSWIWAEGDGLMELGFLFIVTSVIAAVCYALYRRKWNKTFKYRGVPCADL